MSAGEAPAPPRPGTGADPDPGAGPATDPGLTIVVPAYDEEACLADVVRATLAAAEAGAGVPFEVLVVDDGSRDRTAAIAEELAAADPRVRCVRRGVNGGSGQAIRTGIEHARHELVIYVPADGQFEVTEIGAYVDAALGRRARAAAGSGSGSGSGSTTPADIVIGVRLSRDDYTPYRLLQSWLFLRLANAMFGTRFDDVNWVHLWRRSIFERVRPRSRGVFFLEETLVLAGRAGFRVVQVDSAYRPRAGGVAKGAHPLTTLRTLLEMAALRLRLWLGRA